ncbi:ribosomal L11 methyltransferase [Oleidesulfovibrio alaskensis G20]|uniref:Ribosomal protein L11 methyltransferase n=1 Tax=Oleidesulfovibrio alaskensis (strain ATCC BAA-1058 / DSM 17464 / G20) TaxID=207559 RepID=Q312B5_OLEA2|nr:50S ribosomal protein L11 methyltransferase [Oleidesulfovibrio alaskensis]ABB38231.1 ribosomal L11 methyltransferase [Oleidesulfovibrio alaskensis G20]MBG0774439.1 50S ribosomal protein L11 methyltransferase [Oleidesulfovibrio alaskensis]
MADLIRIDIVVPEEFEDITTGVLTLRVAQGWEEDYLPTGESLFRVYTDNPQFCEDLVGEVESRVPEARVERESVPQQDWVAAWRDYFTPVEAGSRFMVIAPWMHGEVDLKDRMPIVIEPKTAFGTGHHPTTALCLGAVSALADKGRISAGMRFLDLGTGSGILGIGCAMLGLSGVGSDIDLLAVENTTENKEINNVSDKFEVRLGSVEAVQGEQYDLVLANILAQPLKELAQDIVALMRPGGCLVLSGLLELQADGVEAVYTALGLPQARREVQGDWAALIWE